MSNVDLNNLKHVMVQMKIPMAFDVLNSFKIGEDDNGKPYKVCIDGVCVEIRFKRIYDFRYKNDVANDFFIDKSGYYRIGEDRNSLLSYMEVQVWFDKQMIYSDKINKDIIRNVPYQFIEASLPYLNKFINMYVSITGQFWLRRVVENDILSYHCLLIDSNEKKEIIISPFDGKHIVEYKKSQFKIKDEEDKYLRHHLVNSNYSWENDMVAFANNSYKLGMYNIALVQLAILFENFIYSNLKKLELSRSKLDKIKKKESCGCLVGISEICSRGINEQYGYDFGSTNEWNDVKNNLLKLRNKIVHGEQVKEITELEYLKSQSAKQAAEKKLQEEVFS